MRIARVSHGGGIWFAVLEDGWARAMAGPPIGDVSLTDQRVRIEECRLLAPVLPSKVVGVAGNTVAGAASDAPVLFLKPSTTVVGPGEPIRRPPACERLEADGQLAVVVRGLVRNADEATAARSILGYTCANDVTAPDLLARDGQWTRAKGFDTFCPLGPWIDTDLDWATAEMRTRVNGEERSSAALKDMRLDPAQLVSAVSRVMTLLPGDVILCGSAAGVAPIEPDDVCEIEVSGIAPLSNGVVAA